MSYRKALAYIGWGWRIYRFIRRAPGRWTMVSGTQTRLAGLPVGVTVETEYNVPVDDVIDAILSDRKYAVLIETIAARIALRARTTIEATPSARHSKEHQALLDGIGTKPAARFTRNDGTPVLVALAVGDYEESVDHEAGRRSKNTKWWLRKASLHVASASGYKFRPRMVR